MFETPCFGTLKRSKIDPQFAPKSCLNFDTLKVPNLCRFGYLWGLKKSPRNRSLNPVCAPGDVCVVSSPAWGFIEVSSCPCCGPLEPSWATFGPSWGSLGASWSKFSPQLFPPSGTKKSTSKSFQHRVLLCHYGRVMG